ncbi:MAG: energy-coupled thiamine transporter ThiT, partial [Lachnospiraceae bacterium]|nr:energy-coupled thiamine transporter ThiT [Lachnospiraceae bacterium]
MLYNVVVSGDETTYVPTALGNALLAAVIVTLLLVAVVFAKVHTKELAEKPNPAANDAKSGKLTIKQLGFSAMAIA